MTYSSKPEMGKSASGYKIAQNFTYNSSREDWWLWNVWIEASDDLLDVVNHVVYTFYETFSKPVRKISDRKTKFMLSSEGRGVFTIYAKLYLNDKTEIPLEHELYLEYPDRTPQVNFEKSGDERPGRTFRGFPDIHLTKEIEHIENENPGGSAQEKPGSVLLGASAPGSAKPGQQFTARFVAYIKDLEEEMKNKLKDLSPSSKIHTGIKKCFWQVGTVVKVRLTGNHLNVDPAEESFTWNGESVILDFDAIVDDTAEDEITILKFDILIDNIVIARLRIDLEITSAPDKPERKKVIAEPIRTAFASYASEDRLRVLDRVAEIVRNGVDVFLDCMSIKAGEQWKPRLQQEIKDRETFLLFWSSNAMKSKWVTWEWQTALAQRGIQGIEAHPLESPNEAPPPPELGDLHFNDVYMLVRKANERNI